MYKAKEGAAHSFIFFTVPSTELRLKKGEPLLDTMTSVGSSKFSIQPLRMIEIIYKKLLYIKSKQGTHSSDNQMSQFHLHLAI